MRERAEMTKKLIQEMESNHKLEDCFMNSGSKNKSASPPRGRSPPKLEKTDSSLN